LLFVVLAVLLAVPVLFVALFVVLPAGVVLLF
jgi:hypothetical protein